MPSSGLMPYFKVATLPSMEGNVATLIISIRYATIKK